MICGPRMVYKIHGKSLLGIWKQKSTKKESIFDPFWMPASKPTVSEISTSSGYIVPHIFELDDVDISKEKVEGFGDRNEEMQDFDAPLVNEDCIKILYTYAEPNETWKPLWWKEEAVGIRKNNAIEIKWDREYWRMGDLLVTMEKLLKSW